MKKTLLKSIFLPVLSLLALSSAFSAEFSGDLLSKPSRIFELGIDANVAYGNSNFKLNELLTKNLVFDLKALAHDVPDDGFSLGLYNKETIFINLNLNSRFRFGLFTNVETYGRFNVEKELFEILGEGMSIGSRSADIEGSAESYLCIGGSFQTIIKDFGVKFTPTYFAPLFYVPTTTATATVKTNSSGKIVAEASADVDIYTGIDMHDFMENGKHFSDLDLGVGNILSGGGFDLSVEVERNWLEGLNAGGYIRIPMVPGTLKNKMRTRVWANFTAVNTLGYLLNDGENYSKDSGHSDFTYSSEHYNIHRPFKLGLNATYMPLGAWFKIQPALGFAVRSPYSSDAKFYPEYALDFRLSVVKRIFNFNLGTAYQNQLFQQRFGFSLNFRALEILAQASWCGTTFTSSFKRDGYGAIVGVRIGW